MPDINDFYRVRPFYLCIDSSASKDGAGIDFFNKALGKIHVLIASDPIVNDQMRIGVISFSESAEVLLPPSKMSDLIEIPKLVAKEGTNYGNAFECLKQTIQRDITILRAENKVEVHRPIVLFISGSKPTDTEWLTAHAAIADKSWSISPHMIAIGFGGALTDTIREIATKVDKSGNFFAYHVEDDANLDSVILEIFKAFIFNAQSLPRNVSRLT